MRAIQFGKGVVYWGVGKDAHFLGGKEQGPFCRGRGTFLVNEFSDSVYGPLSLAWKSRSARTEESGEDEEEIGTNGDNSRDIWLCGVGEPVLWDGGGVVVVEEEVWGKFGDRWGHQWAASLLLGAASSKDLSRFCVFIYFDKFCHFNPIQGNDNRTERPFIILSILAKVGADLEAHFRFQANKLSVTNSLQISTLLHICLSFFPCLSQVTAGSLFLYWLLL